MLVEASCETDWIGEMLAPELQIIRNSHQCLVTDPLYCIICRASTYIEPEYILLIGLDVDRRKTTRQDLDGYFMRFFRIIFSPSM